MLKAEQSGPITEPLWNGAGQQDSVTENPFVFCGYKVSHVIGQNTHSRNIFSVHGFLNLSVILPRS